MAKKIHQEFPNIICPESLMAYWAKARNQLAKFVTIIFLFEVLYEGTSQMATLLLSNLLSLARQA